jgi:hypothetical protein
VKYFAKSSGDVNLIDGGLANPAQNRYGLQICNSPAARRWKQVPRHGTRHIYKHSCSRASSTIHLQSEIPARLLLQLIKYCMEPTLPCFPRQLHGLESQPSDARDNATPANIRTLGSGLIHLRELRAH